MKALTLTTLFCALLALSACVEGDPGSEMDLVTFEGLDQPILCAEDGCFAPAESIEDADGCPDYDKDGCVGEALPVDGAISYKTHWECTMICAGYGTIYHSACAGSRAGAEESCSAWAEGRGFECTHSAPARDTGGSCN